jgi:hypothetical protein
LIAVLGLSPVRIDAESLVLSTADTRLILGFQVSASAVQTVLPADWQPTPLPSGPSTGANVLLIFVDGIAQFDADGKPAAGGTNRFVVAAVPGRNIATGGAGGMVVGGVAAHPDGAPGAYKNYIPAQVKQDRTLRTDGSGPGSAEESGKSGTRPVAH